MHVMRIFRDRLAGLLIMSCFLGAASPAHADNEPKNMTPGETVALAARYVVHDGDAASIPLADLHREFIVKAMA